MSARRPAPESGQVRGYFQRAVRRFDAIYEPRRNPLRRLADRLFRRSMRLRFRRTLAGLEPVGGKTVLDVGCGAGRYGLALAGQGAKSVLGVDFAAAMVAAARERAASLGLAEACRFVQADFALMEPGGTFDHVIAMGLFDYVDDPLPLLAKMVRLARRSVMASFPLRGGLVQWGRKLVFRYYRRCPVHFYAAAEVRRLAELAGGLEHSVERLDKDLFLTIRVAPAAGEGR